MPESDSKNPAETPFAAEKSQILKKDSKFFMTITLIKLAMNNLPDPVFPPQAHPAHSNNFLNIC